MRLAYGLLRRINRTDSYSLALCLILKNKGHEQAHDSSEHSFPRSLSLSLSGSIGLLAHLASPISPPLSLLYECHRIGKRATYTHALVDCLRNDLTGLIYHKLSSTVVQKNDKRIKISFFFLQIIEIRTSSLSFRPRSLFV